MSFCMVLILWGFKGALSGLRPFLAAVSFLKMVKNTFHFTLKALFVLKIFKFLSCVFGHVAKLLDKKDKLDFRFYDITALRSKGNQTMKVRQLIGRNMRNIFLGKSSTNVVKKLVPYLFLNN